MENRSLYYLNQIDRRIKTNWNSKDKLLTYKMDLTKFRENSSGFNQTFALVGLALTHTGLLLKSKTVLHRLESKALPHLAICLGVGLASGTLFGQILGKNYFMQRRANSINSLIEQRLEILK